jgi:hypothetical protein
MGTAALSAHLQYTPPGGSSALDILFQLSGIVYTPLAEGTLKIPDTTASGTTYSLLGAAIGFAVDHAKVLIIKNRLNTKNIVIAGGVFWCNEKAEGYFGHEIYLLPNQSIPEHRHLPTKDADGKALRCKIESWQVRHGSVYGFSEVGEPNLDKYPEAKARLSKLQIPFLKSVHVEGAPLQD